MLLLCIQNQDNEVMGHDGTPGTCIFLQGLDGGSLGLEFHCAVAVKPAVAGAVFAESLLQVR